jgi:hypothetical protein
MQKKFFKSAKRKLTFNEYMQELMVLATHIKEVSSGLQRYTSAQFELALISFADLKELKKEMDTDVDVTLPPLECDFLAGFDWLDLAVSYNDPDAINYFMKNLNDAIFALAYKKYKNECRPDCALQNYEPKTSKLEI